MRRSKALSGNEADNREHLIQAGVLPKATINIKSATQCQWLMLTVTCGRTAAKKGGKRNVNQKSNK